MNRLQLRQQVVATLLAVAPEVDPEDLRDAVPLRKQVDLDSLDWLVFLVRLHELFGVDIPESDYGTLVTLSDVVAYLEQRLPPTG